MWLLSFGGIASAQRAFVDPNTHKAQAKTAHTEPVDARLAKPLTYDSGYKRLHVVIEDVGRMSGVSIACGSSSKDWRVRDIPVVVHVNDLPLGKLLRAIADATHTSFETVRVTGETEISYRVYRRADQQAEIDSFRKARSDASLARAAWQWDALSAYGKSNEINGVDHRTWLIGKLIASLGAKGRERMLNGDTITFTKSEPGISTVYDELYKLLYEQERTSPDEGYVPTDIDLQTAVFKVKLVDFGDAFGSHLEMMFNPFRYGESHAGAWTSINEGDSLNGKGLNIAPYPKPFVWTSQITDSQDLIRLIRDTDWGKPLLSKKIDVELPKDAKDPRLVDLIKTVASAGGCNIVVEDFASQLSAKTTDSSVSSLVPRFKKNTSIAEALRNVFLGVVNYLWLFDENDNLIIGQTSSWRDMHADMPSEAYLNDLKRKINGNGVDLDGAVHLVNVSQNWIARSRDLACLGAAQTDVDPIWQLYDALQPTDKLLARSDDGLPLAKLDPDWVSGFFTEQKRRGSLACESPILPGAGGSQKWLDDRKSIWDEYVAKCLAMSDPRIIATMVMRVKQSPTTYRYTVTKGTGGNDCISCGPPPAVLGMFDYSASISYIVDGRNRQMTASSASCHALPIRTPEREAEIIKAASKGK